MTDCYSEKGNNITVLTGKNFNGSTIRNGEPGLLHVFANWCSHCISKVDNMLCLADAVKEEGWKIYCMDGSLPENNQAAIALDIQHFPMFFTVSSGGKTTKLDVNNVEGAVEGMCNANPKKCKILNTKFNSCKK